MNTQASLVALAERPVPRYTSYPTAPHFHAGVESTTYRRWLSELDPAAAVSLYLHVPFCRAICHYCGCHTKAVRRFEPIQKYAATLRAELELVAAQSAARRVTAIHWGGGTPSILGEHEFARVFATIGEVFNLAGLKDHAIELDPREVTAEFAQVLARAGVNRASLGVQDTDPDVQAVIGRIQPDAMVHDAIRHLAAAGITALNVDLIFGLPRQSVESVIRTAQTVADMGPQRIAVFGYAHVPWFKTHQRLMDEAALPDAAARFAQGEAIRECLRANGYAPIGLDHYARRDDQMANAVGDGGLRRNFQGYTTDDADVLLGFGASSIGKLPQGYVQNAVDFGGYSRAISTGRPAVTRGLAFTGDDRMRADVIEQLMCRLEVDLLDVAQVHGAGFEAFAVAMTRLAPLMREGLVTIAGTRITIPDHARPFARLVASAFDAYLGLGAARHSKAV